jgi:DNA-binding transcriptional ArsR family regulator
VRLDFDLRDLAATRFAISAGWELAASLTVLREPARAAIHLPWVVQARRRTADLDLGEALALTPPGAYMPDFLTPPPESPLPSIERDLERIRSTPVAQVAWELAHMDPPQRVRSLDGLVDTLRGYFGRAVGPWWPRIVALLQADLHRRARLLAEQGPAALFADLHPALHWDDGTLTVRHRHDEHVRLAGRGLVLVPSAFTWRGPALITREPWQPTLIYPARGAGLLWETEAQDGGRAVVALTALLGRTRARVLLACDTPTSTTDVATRLGISAPSASQHLSVLRDAGLVAAQRDRRRVLHARTRLGDDLAAS